MIIFFSFLCQTKQTSKQKTIKQKTNVSGFHSLIFYLLFINKLCACIFKNYVINFHHLHNYHLDLFTRISCLVTQYPPFFPTYPTLMYFGNSSTSENICLKVPIWDHGIPHYLLISCMITGNTFCKYYYIMYIQTSLCCGMIMVSIQ